MPTKRIRDIPDIDRPREKLIAKGAAALSDTELLAILLGSGIKGISVLKLASRILDSLGQRLDRADVDTLQEIEGVGRAKACQIVRRSNWPDDTFFRGKPRFVKRRTSFRSSSRSVTSVRSTLSACP